MALNTNILQSNLVKQIAGGLAGMAVAGLLYVAIDQASYLNIKGLLVSTNTVSENAGQVSVNATNLDDATRRQLASHANAVAEQLQSSAASSSIAPETPMTQNAADRRAKRVFANEVSSAYASAPTFTNDHDAVIAPEQRVAIRAARIANLPAPAFAPQPINAQGDTAAVTQPDAPVITARPAAPQTTSAMDAGHSEKLPNSGLGLNVLVMLSLFCAFFSTKSGFRDRVVALLPRGL